MTQADTHALSCSFCQKSQDSVSKLITSPSNYPRVYICNECISVCATILEEDQDRLAAASGTPVTYVGKHPLLAHRLASSLLTAVERWIRSESLGGDAARELADVRKVAMEMMSGC
jgi:ClpX C4-type zinc finger